MYCRKCGMNIGENTECPRCSQLEVISELGKKAISKKKKTGIMVPMLLAMCLCLVAGIGAVWYFTNAGTKITVEGEFENNLILITDGKSYGLMDAYGNIVEPCFYDEIRNLDTKPEGCIDGVWIELQKAEKKSEIEYLYDSLGYFMVSCEKYNAVWSSDSELIQIGARDNNGNMKYGYINGSGEEVIELKYDKVWDFSEGLARVCVKIEDNTDKEKDGFYIPLFGEDDSNYKDKYGYVNELGEEVIELNYDEAGDFSEGLACVGVEDSNGNMKYGYINESGEEVIALKYDEAWSFLEGLACAGVEDSNGNIKYGYINKSGKEIIELKYDMVRSFSEGLAYVGVEDSNGNMKYSYINELGEEVIELKYDEASSFSEGLARVVIEASNGDMKYGYINKSGKEIIKLKYDSAGDFSEGLARVGVEDSNGNWKYGYINELGEEVIELKYDIAAWDFSEGLACVGVEDSNGDIKYGYVNETGEEVIELKYSGESWMFFDVGSYDIVHFSDGVAKRVIRENHGNKYGYINEAGKEIISCNYISTGMDENYLILVDNDTFYICKSLRALEDMNGQDLGEFRYLGTDKEGKSCLINSKEEILQSFDENFLLCNEYYKKALKKEEAGDMENARVFLKKASKLQPNNPYMKELLQE